MKTWTGCASCCAARSFPSRPELALLREIAAAPRPTGGEAIAAARDRCARELEGLGFRTEMKPFEFSAAPGRFGTPLLGGLAGLLVGTSAAMASGGHRYIPFVMLAIGASAIAAAGRWLIRHGIIVLRANRRRGVNLVGVRGAATAVWLSAHLDSKSQPVPTIVRSAGIVAQVIGYSLALLAATLCALRVPGDDVLWPIALLVALPATIPVLMSVVRERSPGAVDNASGVVAVIEAARSLDAGLPVGVVISDAEELGLAGARAIAGELATPGAVVLNCDGVDDHGEAVVMHAGGGAAPVDLLIAIRRASDACGVPIRVRRLLPGVLADSVAFADAGAQTVTFSRGSPRTLARIHTPRDDLAHLRGTGIADMSRLMAATVRAVSDAKEHEWKS